MRYVFIIAGLFWLASFTNEGTDTTNSVSAKNRLAKLTHDYVSIRYPGENFDRYIYVGVKRQKLYLLSDTSVIDSYTISASQYGVGSEMDSEKTPLGLHKIESMIGDAVPVSGILLGKSYTGKRAKIIKEPKKSKTDDVTTRALRLEGMEKGLNKGGNKDSYDRQIYIHGTPEEGLIGQPASHGCIRMVNTEIIELFERVEKGTLVIILNN